MDKQLIKKIWTFKRVGILVGIAVFLAFSVWTFAFARHETTLSVARDRLTISEVSRGVFDEFIIVTGVVQPLKTYQLDAMEGGYISKKFLDGGAKVSAGDMILKLDNQQLTLDFMNRETEMYRLINELENTRLRLRQDKFLLKKTLSELDFQIRQARDEHDRNAKLFDQKVIAEQDFLKTKIAFERLQKQHEIEVENQQFQEENSVIQIKQLEGTLDRTRLNMSMMKKNLENLAVRAPVSGLLSRVDVEIGASISAGQNIGQIDDLDGFKMRVEVDEHYVSRIFPSLEGSFDFNEKKVKLAVFKVFPEVKNGRFEVDMTFLSPPEGIRRGQSVSVRLQLGKSSDALLLASGGFFSSTGGNWVYILQENGQKASRRSITVGRKNPQFYEVLDGLSAGELVITSAYDGFGEKEILVFR